ncbi:hypothetical protein VTL71DRAFT_7071, partial [Oculimacula yallundae]
MIRRRKQTLKKKKHVMSTMIAMSGISGEDITVFFDLAEQAEVNNRQKDGGWSTRKSEAVKGKRVWRGPKSRISNGKDEHDLKFSFDFKSGLKSYSPKP